MTREQRLAAAFVELADTLVAEYDLIEFMHTLTDRCVELLDVDAAGLMVADQRGELRAIASSSAAIGLVETYELEHRQGPCYDCFHSGQQVVNVGAAGTHARWPGFAAALNEAGFQSVHALPMSLRADVIGAINLFCVDDVALGAEQESVGQALADVATIGLLQERAVRERELLSEQLQAALNSRVLIEQAKGVLAARAGIEIDQAFTAMRRYARRRGRTLSSVAAAVIDGSIRTAELRVG